MTDREAAAAFREILARELPGASVTGTVNGGIAFVADAPGRVVNGTFYPILRALTYEGKSDKNIDICCTGLRLIDPAEIYRFAGPIRSIRRFIEGDEGDEGGEGFERT